MRVVLYLQIKGLYSFNYENAKRYQLLINKGSECKQSPVVVIIFWGHLFLHLKIKNLEQR